MNKPGRIDIKLCDGQLALITVSNEDAEITTSWDAGALDDLIFKLSQARAGMADEVPRSIDFPAHLGLVPDPLWFVSHSPNLVLGVRHPGFGWLAFRLEPDEGNRLADELSRPAS